MSIRYKTLDQIQPVIDKLKWKPKYVLYEKTDTEHRNIWFKSGKRQNN